VISPAEKIANGTTRVQITPGNPLNGLAAYGSEGHRENRSEQSEKPPLTLQWFGALESLPQQPQLVSGLLQTGSLFVVYGESNSGKTFFMLDLALAVAAGQPWRSKRCRKGLVIYIAGEGASSVRARVAAYRLKHPEMPGSLPFAIIPQAVDFLDADSIAALAAAIAAAEIHCGQSAALVIIDTFARAVAGGDENSAKDVGLAVAAADRIRAETGAAVGFVHHAGKDPSKGARGSSALRAATDTEVLIEGQTGQRIATVSKQRDLENGERMPFELESVEIGIDPEDGTAITSCVVRHTDAQSISTTAVKQLRGKAQRQLVNALRARTESAPERIWSLEDLRTVARDLGQHKNTARSVVDAIVLSPYMRTCAFGYMFTDGRDEERNGTK
jgi:hypothetical protein